MIMSQPAVAGRLLQLGAGRLNEKEDGLVKSERLAERVTGDHHPRAAMPFAPVIERELDLRSDPERPFREETHSLG